jgi:hypothetical protein
LESFKFIALNDAAYSRVLSRVARLGRSFWIKVDNGLTRRFSLLHSLYVSLF